MAAGGALIARAGFTAHLDAVGIIAVVVSATMVYFTWRHGRRLYLTRGGAGMLPHHQPGALALLTTATLLTGALALIVTIAI